MNNNEQLFIDNCIDTDEYRENRRLYFDAKNNRETSVVPLNIQDGKHYLIHSESGTYMEFDDEKDFIDFLVEFEHDDYYTALAGQEIRKASLLSPICYPVDCPDM